MNEDLNNIPKQEVDSGSQQVDSSLSDEIKKQISELEDTIEIQNGRISDLEEQKSELNLKISNLTSNNNNNMDPIKTEPNQTTTEEPKVVPVVEPKVEEPVVTPAAEPVKTEPVVEPQPIKQEPAPQEPVTPKVDSKPVEDKKLSIEERLEQIEMHNAQVALENEIESALVKHPKASRDDILAKLALGDTRDVLEIADDVEKRAIAIEDGIRQRILEEEKAKIEEQVRGEIAGNKSIPQSQGNHANALDNTPAKRFVTPEQKRSNDWSEAVDLAKKAMPGA